MSERPKPEKSPRKPSIFARIGEAVSNYLDHQTPERFVIEYEDSNIVYDGETWSLQQDTKSQYENDQLLVAPAGTIRILAMPNYAERTDGVQEAWQYTIIDAAQPDEYDVPSGSGVYHVVVRKVRRDPATSDRVRVTEYMGSGYLADEPTVTGDEWQKFNKGTRITTLTPRIVTEHERVEGFQTSTSQAFASLYREVLSCVDEHRGG